MSPSFAMRQGFKLKMRFWICRSSCTTRISSSIESTILITSSADRDLRQASVQLKKMQIARKRLTPVLQRPCAPTLRILLRLPLLRQMALAISNSLTHMIDVLLVVLVRIAFWILFQDRNNLTTAITIEARSVHANVGRRTGAQAARY